jgi:hypothetical protein
MGLSITPFNVQLPAGYQLQPDSSSGAAASTAPAAPVDVVNISGTFDAGHFTAVADDTYRLGSLFKGAAPAGQAIAGYRVAMGGGGQLLLGAEDVSDRTSFTADEFARLTYKVGADGSQQSLVVAAQTGKRLADGFLSNVTDSQAMQITASVTGTRSINAMNALTTKDAGTDADIVSVVKEAGILTGIGAGRPTMQTSIAPDFVMPLSTLATSAGAFTATGGPAPTSPVDPALFNSTTTGGAVTTGVFSGATSPLMSALLLLGGQATGAFKVAGSSTGLSQAIAAYTIAKGL